MTVVLLTGQPAAQGGGDSHRGCMPVYSPDLNPIERLWLLIKAEWFTDFIAKDTAALMTRLDQALNWVVARASDNSRTCAIKQ
jgi:hypothetical protein